MSEEIKVKLDGKEITNEIVDETTSTDESLKTEESTKEEVDKKIPYDRFKAKVDEVNALKEKLAEYERTQAEKERKELEEREEYKTLYEQAIQQVETAKQEAIAIKKSTLLTNAGYSEEQAELFTNLLQGETDEELAASVEQLKAANPPIKRDYVDPSEGNGRKQTPPKKDGEEAGKSLFQRLKDKGKVK